MSSRRALLLLLCAPLVAGCYGTHHIPVRESTGFEKATGVTLKSGEEIVFMATGATVVNDTLHAITKHDHIAIPMDSITRVSERRFSPVQTGGLVIGVAVVAGVALLVAIASALGNIN